MARGISQRTEADLEKSKKSWPWAVRTLQAKHVGTKSILYHLEWSCMQMDGVAACCTSVCEIVEEVIEVVIDEGTEDDAE